MSKYVDYYASLASPYTYMGGRRLPEIIENTGADFHIKPIMGGQVMAATGGLPVAKPSTSPPIENAPSQFTPRSLMTERDTSATRTRRFT